MSRMFAGNVIGSEDRRMRIAAAEFVNPIYDGADPWVVRHGETYYSCKTGRGGCIEVWASDSMLELGEPNIVWAPPRQGWNCAQVWAPELHYIRGRWYIYYTASNGLNENHRMGVLRSEGEDAAGPYTNLGQMYTGDELQTKSNNRWAIDGTVLELHGELYFLWSGWEDHRDVQHLYIARMSDPATICSNRVQVCPNNCHEWEHVGESRRERGLHEGPSLLHRHGRVFLIYSCSGSWQTTYKLGMLSMPDDADPMDHRSWTKNNRPVMEPTEHVFGVGHCSFTTSVDGSEDWILFHAKKGRGDGWNRTVYAQQFGWNEDGFPDFGRPTSPRQQVAAPGTTARPNHKRAA